MVQRSENEWRNHVDGRLTDQDTDVEKLRKDIEGLRQDIKALTSMLDGGKMAASVIKWLVGLGVSVAAIWGVVHGVPR